ncbi:MAG: zinc-ribbon domain-containing protein [Clostridiales bacterium]|nr:zinc-ribbon domain-containing protein [Candidatus Apopatousia equi]
MKFCSHCGNQVQDDVLYCSKCGEKIGGVVQANYQYKSNGCANAGKIFMIISSVISALAIIPLLWCVPMTTVAIEKINRKEKMSVGFKVCTLLFVSQIAGILFLCDSNC